MATPVLMIDTLQKNALNAGFAAAFGGGGDRPVLCGSAGLDRRRLHSDSQLLYCPETAGKAVYL